MATTQKVCDDSCIGLECSDHFCHDGESNGTHLVKCESCGRSFCMAHLKEYELSIFMCDPCALADRTAFPISIDQARALLTEFGVDFDFVDSHSRSGRKGRATRDCGIVWEGASL